MAKITEIKEFTPATRAKTKATEAEVARTA
jgi:hypothetical protein